eukprot:TRINITY_DN56511_c0_g1_i1.p1 TRINITY_DN56511_c0_g1~~TRINITY_DN56511_c0_g1_i1.p1  ORF type:complete len:213 (-),score=26.11 TRINITY_DN56511_c0_g1_i1:303-941(-)
MAHEREGMIPPGLNNTRLCKYYKFGTCYAGKSCPFAHGKNRLVDRPNLKQTQMCKYYLRGRCKHDACPFAHGAGELRDSDSVQPQEDWRAGEDEPSQELETHASAYEEVRMLFHDRSLVEVFSLDGSPNGHSKCNSNVNSQMLPVGKTAAGKLCDVEMITSVDHIGFEEDANTYSPAPAAVPLPFFQLSVDSPVNGARAISFGPLVSSVTYQ